MRYPRIALAGAAGLLMALAASGGTVTAVPLPNPQVPGFTFPESEATIVTWVQEVGNGTPEAASAFESMHLHGWGIWTALTLETAQVDNAQKLRVFETWYTPQEVDTVPSAKTPAALASVPRHRSALLQFAQFHHGLDDSDHATSGPNEGSETVFGYVKFDPTATAHVMQEQLLSKAALGQLLQGGSQQIPVFPSTSLTLKSAFQLITAATRVQGRYYRLNVWTGPPQAPQAWGPSQWPGVVWIDIQGGGSGAGQVDTVASIDGSSRTDATTYPVSSMINHRISAREAEQFNAG